MEDVVARFESEDKYPVDLAVEDRSFQKGDLSVIESLQSLYSEWGKERL